MVSHNNQPSLSFEHIFWRQDLIRVAGIDEAGRGAWAGPVAAGAVILPAQDDMLALLPDVRDSKQLNAGQREQAAFLIRQYALAWGVGYASSVEIDGLGIVPATRLAMLRAIAQCQPAPQALLIDAVRLVTAAQSPQQSIIHGDCLSLSIAAASIIAKTSRDEWMRSADQAYPEYGFARHKGYGTRLHQEALLRRGPCLIHRMSFRPLHYSFYSGKDEDRL